MIQNKPKKFAIAFDIDGCIQRGHGNILPETRSALWRLSNHPQLKSQGSGSPFSFPLLFLTNGGGETESARATKLSKWLHYEISPSQILLSHTPFKTLMKSYQNKRVLIVGRSKKNLDVAVNYGFQDVCYLDDFAHSLPFLYPNKVYRPPQSGTLRIDKHHTQILDPKSHKFLTEHKHPNVEFIPLDYKPIEAILVFQTPSDIGEANQVIMDILHTGGDVLLPLYVEHAQSTETGSSPYPFPVSWHSPPPIFYCNMDYTYSDAYPLPRFTLGSFIQLIESSWHNLLYDNQRRFSYLFPNSKESFPKHIPAFYCGKPTSIQYLFAAHMLVDSSIDDIPIDDAQLWSDSPDVLDSVSNYSKLTSNFDHIFAIGDSLDSDIRGATNAKSPWVPVLVKTGVWSENDPIHEDLSPLIVNDVDEAVTQIFKICGLHPFKAPTSDQITSLRTSFELASKSVPKTPASIVTKHIKDISVITLKFTDFKPHMLYAYLRLRSEVFVVEQNCVYQDLDNLDQDAWHVLFYKKTSLDSLSSSSLALSTQNLSLVGCARFYEDSLGQIWLGRIIVSPKYRHQGIGHLIVQESISNIRTKYATKFASENSVTIKIHAQEHLRTFYTTAGFAVDGKVFILDNIDHIPMTITLS